MSKTVKIRCSGTKDDGTRCTRKKKFTADEVPEKWYCWQHPDPAKNVIENNELTDKQKAFCEEYLIDLNATQAAIRAGYSEKTADVQGPRLLGNVRVRNEIGRLKDARSKRTQITADRVLEELALIGYSKITDYLEVVEKNITIGYKKNGDPIKEKQKVVEIKETDEMDQEAIKAISQIKQTKHGISLKLYDKPGALEDIGRHLGMWNDSLDITMNELPDINLVRGDKGGS